MGWKGISFIFFGQVVMALIGIRIDFIEALVGVKLDILISFICNGANLIIFEVVNCEWYLTAKLISFCIFCSGAIKLDAR